MAGPIPGLALPFGSFLGFVFVTTTTSKVSLTWTPLAIGASNLSLSVL